MEDTVAEVRIGQSKFGLGVFSRRRFQVDEAVGEITGEIVDNPDYQSEFCMQLGDLTLEPTPPFRYLNHCCQPNCEIVHWHPEEKDGDPETTLWLHALREILPDEELTIDYAWPADAAIPCGCGARRCRGWIVDSGQMEQLPVPHLAHRQAISHHDQQPAA